MERDIKGLHDHPDSERLLEYDMDPPPGKWRGRLDDCAWGASSNLFCFFSHAETGRRYRLSVYGQNGYAPAQGGPHFDAEDPGGVFEITIAKRGGMPVFLSARKVP